MNREHIESLIKRSHAATTRLLDEVGESLFARSAIYYLDLAADGAAHAFTMAEAG